MMEDRFKFKVWDKENKCFLIERKQEFNKQFFAVYELDDKSAFSSLGWCLEKKEFKVIQSIGIRDLNKKLIYDGFILKDINFPQFLYKVIWDKDKCKFKFQIANKTNIDYNLIKVDKEYSEKYLEVIGNIYENKDLLK